MAKTRSLALPPVKKNSLYRMELFQGVSFDDFQGIEKQLVEKKYKRRETIFQEEDPADSIWFVKQGHVKEVNHSLDGKIQTIGMIGADGIFGVSSFDGGKYGFHSIAVTDVTVISIPIHAFRNLMAVNSEMARLVVSKILKLLRQSRDSQTVSQESVEKRLLHVLLEMAAEFGNTIPMTHREIASIAGTTAETCSRTFSRWESVGLIDARHGKFTLKNLDALKTRINEL
jgi:CRP/FNR family transcriptional regulator